ncbi:hypothetical protein [Streptomyces sp. 1222.5]|uniref:hypothetical protein n=1 Tax=Streptomyces sp. 1222.5 TaxID=1881026 RepID=UPI003D743A2F
MEAQQDIRPDARPGHAIIDVMARSTYEPSDDAAALFARIKAAHDTLRELRGPLHEMAAREMRDAGATVGDLARLTGYDAEKYRLIARAEGIERRRPPTRGRLSDQSD